MRGYWTFLVVCILGTLVLCDSHLKLALYPLLPRPHIVIETRLPPADAKEIDRKVTLPLLQVLADLEGVRSNRSCSENGCSRIFLTFSHRCSYTTALSRVQLALVDSSINLPQGAHAPQVSNRGREDLSIFAVAFPLDQQSVSQEFSSEAEGIPGITRLFSSHHNSTRITAEYIPEEGELSALPPQSIAAFLQNRCFSGTISAEQRSIPLSVQILPSRNISSLELKGVISRITPSSNKNSSIHRLNSIPQHIVVIHADNSVNHIKVCRRLAEMSEHYRSGRIIFNRGKELEKIIHTTLFTVLCGLFGVAVLVILQVGRPDREILLMLGSLPMLLLTGVIAVIMAGLSLDIMTLAGISVSCGLIVDAAVLFYEESSSMGVPRALSAVRDPILLSNATTLSIFIPILLLPVSIRSTFTGFLIVMTAVLVCGTIWTLLIFPRYLRNFPFHTKMIAAFHRRIRFLLITLHPFRGKKFRCLFIYLLVCSFPLYWCGDFDFRFFPHIAHHTIHTHIEFPAATHAEYIDTMLIPYYKRVQGISYVESLTTTAHKGGASMSVTCTLSSDTRRVIDLLQRIPLPAGASMIVDSQSNPRKSFQVRLYGIDQDKLRKLIKETAAFVQAQHPQYQIFFHFKDPPPSYTVNFSGIACALKGISPLKAAKELLTLITTAPSAKIGIENQHDLIIRPPQSPKNFASFYNSFRIIEPGLDKGKNTPLSELSKLTRSSTKGPLERSNKALYTGFSIIPNTGNLQQAIQEISTEIQQYNLPHGYSFDLAPQIKKEREQRNWVITSIVLATLLIPLIVYSYYNDTARTLFVLSFIPPSISIPLLLLNVFEIPLSIPVLTGFLVNVGLSVNNAVVLLSAIEAPSLYKADFIGALCKKLPSLSASTFTTVAGVIPLLVGTGGTRGVLAGLSIVIAGGSIASWTTLFLGSAIFSSTALFTR